MIEINYWREHNRVTIKGHADYAEEGKDIVCASVSAVAQTLAVNAERWHHDGFASRCVVRMHKGDTEISITPRTAYREAVEMIMVAICAGFEVIANAAPEYVHFNVMG